MSESLVLFSSEIRRALVVPADCAWAAIPPAGNQFGGSHLSCLYRRRVPLIEGLFPAEIAVA